MQILEELRKQNEIGGAQNTIREYILTHPEEVIRMTVDQLSQATFSSHASVVRLIHNLGFEKYSLFKLQLAKEMEQAKQNGHPVDFSMPFQQNATGKEIVSSLSSLYQQTITQIRDSLNIAVLEEIATAIATSRRVLILGVGDTFVTATGFMNRLSKLGVHAILMNQLAEDFAWSVSAEEQDFALMITYRGDYPVFLDNAELLRNRHCPIATITSVGTTLSKKSTYAITIPKVEEADRIGTFYSQLAFEYILSILYSMVYARQYQKNHERLKKISGSV